MFTQAEVNKITGKEEVKPRTKKLNINRFYVGVDCGLDGAIAVFHESGSFVAVHDMPTFTDKKGKRHVDSKELYSILLNYKVLHAYIETVHSSPQMGVASSFSFGRSLGVVQGVLSASEINYSMILPRRWKDYWSLLKTEKDAAREKIIHLLPSSKDLFRRKKDCDRADACLIALCGMGQLREAV